MGPRTRANSGAASGNSPNDSVLEPFFTPGRPSTGGLVSRALSYARIPGSGGSITDEAVSAPSRWYRFRSWRLATLCVVLLVCAWNLGGLANSGSAVVVRSPAEQPVLQAGTLAGPPDENAGSAAASAASGSIADSLRDRLNRLIDGNATKAIREWVSAGGSESDAASQSSTAAAVPSSPVASPSPPAFVFAELPPPEVWDKSADACAAAMNLPKVAILFLTKGDLFHANAWRLWFQSASGVLPVDVAAAALCAGDAASAPKRTDLATLCSLQQLAAPDASPAELAARVIDAQHLFNVYVHAPPGVEDSSLEPLFQGRLVPRRVSAAWGSHQLVEAARNLLLEAYKDPLNQRFFLASESDIPLYDPLTLYQQLMAEGGSRVNGCAHSRMDRRRWSWRMRSAALKAHHWRKASQWFSLTREHAQLVLEDVEVYRRFEEYCHPGWDPDYRRERDCFSDEHYMPTLFAVHRVQTEANCGAVGIAATNWSGGPHPRSYTPEDITPALVQDALRSPELGCDAHSAWESAQKMFVKIDEAFSSGFCKLEVPSYGSHLTSLCKLTARKFPKTTVAATEKLFTDCDNGLNLLTRGVCMAGGAGNPGEAGTP